MKALPPQWPHVHPAFSRFFKKKYYWAFMLVSSSLKLSMSTISPLFHIHHDVSESLCFFNARFMTSATPWSATGSGASSHPPWRISTDLLLLVFLNLGTSVSYYDVRSSSHPLQVAPQGPQWWQRIFAVFYYLFYCILLITSYQGGSGTEMPNIGWGGPRKKIVISPKLWLFFGKKTKEACPSIRL